eukprot:gene3057-3825_t
MSTCIELLSPVFFILILLIIAKAPSSSNDPFNRPVIVNNQSLPNCIAFNENRCFSLMFSPSNSTIAMELMTLMGKINDPPLPVIVPNDTSTLDSLQNIQGGIIAMPSRDDIFNFVQNHPNVTVGGLEFIAFPGNISQVLKDPLIISEYSDLFRYNLLMNVSCPNILASCPKYGVQITMALQNTLNQYIVQQKNITGPPPKISVDTTTFPLYQPSSNAKENKLRTGMIMMGLNGSVYWISWFITCFILNILLTLITIATGSAAQFDFFLSTNFFVNFFLFFLFTLSMGQVAFFILSFIQSTKAAIGIGMTIFIVGSILQLIFSLMGALIFQILYENDSTAATIARIVLYPIPMFHFSKAVTDINAIAVMYQYTGIGFKWSDLRLDINTPGSGATIPETYESFIHLLILAGVYTALAWYFEHVIPGNDGSSHPIYFFLQPSYWGITKKTVKHIPVPSFDDDDVRTAIEKANQNNNQSPVVIKGLSKTYRKIFNPKANVYAVRYLSLSIENSNILCLLGHNGAGKSTTIGMLTGLVSPSSGDALVFGHSIVSDIDSARRVTSVCPQHDILWNELTAREHLQLFSELKGVPSEERQEAINNALESVKLRKVANNQVSTYSGGMKRRLSVAISTIGSPKIIFMDEPTTGMDPQSRRHIWNLIKEIKKDRVIILTTHLMEEADILGDKIVIMSQGVMSCIGNSLQLKSRFGEGYSVNIIARSPENINEIKRFISQHIPNSKLLNESADYLNFGFPLSTDSQILVNFFKDLERLTKTSNSIIRDWGVSHSTMDDVFLKVAKLKHQ